MWEQQTVSIFCYAYRPMNPSSPQDGGFSVNLYTNGQLVFCTFDTGRNVLKMFSFQLGHEVQDRYNRMVSYAAPWLRNVPDLMSNGEDAETEFTFGFNGQPLFRIEDLSRQMGRGFRTIRGHYSRLVYGLFEDIASLLAVYGIDLMPDTFAWQSSLIVPTITTAQQPAMQA